jgi:hypothetical protein
MALSWSELVGCFNNEQVRKAPTVALTECRQMVAAGSRCAVSAYVAMHYPVSSGQIDRLFHE